MTSFDPEELLWELSSTDRDRSDDAPVPPDETLVAYREGRLEAAQAQRLESLLAHSTEARERLIELAESTLSEPSAALRDRLVPPTVASGGHAATAPRPWWPAATAVAAACLLAVGLYLSRPAEVVEVPPFEVSFELLAEIRSQGGTTAGTSGSDFADGDFADGDFAGSDFAGSAFAETPVRIAVEPAENGVAGLDFGLYLRREETLVRLVPGSGLRFEAHRGAAVFEAPAGRLVGSAPGSYELFVVAATQLPVTIELAAGEEAQAVLREMTGGRIYRRSITLLADPR